MYLKEANVNKYMSSEEQEIIRSIQEGKLVVTYEGAIELIQTHFNDLKKQRKLKEWCKNNGLKYNAVINLLSNPDKHKQPNQLLKILEILGYKATLQKTYLYILNK